MLNNRIVNNILEYLEHTAQRLPDKVGYYDDREGFTFSQLTDICQRIGSCLAEHTEPFKPVALLLDSRSVRNIPAQFGTVYAGCCFAPFDILMPPERLKLMLDLLQPAVVLGDEKGLKAYEACGFEGVPVVAYDDAVAHPINEETLHNIRRRTSRFDPVSIWYTSGSTGIPKGAVHAHYTYINWGETSTAMYPLLESEVYANQSPFFYSNCGMDLMGPILQGSTTYIIPAGLLSFPQKFIQCLQDHHVTELTMTPTSYINLYNSGVVTPGCLPDMTIGFLSGETMPYEPLKAWMEAMPNAKWFYYYGATEMFAVAVKIMKEIPRDEGKKLPVGKPFYGQVHILFVDENGNEVPYGEPGEMLVSSPWLGLGYHRDPERTEASWVIDPLGRGYYERFYKCGDVGYMTPEGELVVLGRRDTQIKHIGYRMEIGEVDAALSKIPGWKEGCVLFDREHDKLWCFYNAELTEKQIKAALKETLQRYMIPDVFVHLDEMPHTATMKLNRAALAQMMQAEQPKNE